MNKHQTSRLSYIAAFSGVGAALYYVLLYLPGIPILGTPARMEIAAALSPLFGVVLGPIAGSLAVLLGNTVKTFVPTPSLYGAPFIPAAALSALSAYLLLTRRWWISSAMLVVLIVVAVLLPPFYPVTEQWLVFILAYYDKIAALILSPFISKLLSSKSSKVRYVGLYLLFFVAREVDKAFGCTIFAVPAVYTGIFGIRKLSTVRSLYMVSPLYYLVAYIVEALIVTIIAIPVIRTIKRIPALSSILYVDKVPV